MREPLQVYIGFDRRESEAYEVAEFSIREHASVPVRVTPLKLEQLEAQGLSLRPYRIFRNSVWDIISDAPVSTEFANSRFLTPLLAQSGWALFVDCDVVVLDDIAKLFDLAIDRYAVMCVQHQHEPVEITKMDDQPQTTYPRKNWSSVMLFNCDHSSNQRLTHAMINNTPGRDLHRFCWLDDHEIGALPREWNWLVGVQPKPERPKLAHYTLGGPWIENWTQAEHDALWLHCQNRYRSAG